MQKYIMFLRGINVGKHKQISMPHLVGALESLGYEHVTTYIRSGNIIFSSRESNAAVLQQSIQAHLEQLYEFEIPTIVYSKDNFLSLVKNCPFKPNETQQIFFGFCQNTIEFSQKLLTAQQDEQAESYENILYLQLGPHLLDSPLYKALDKMLKNEQISLRNWKTTMKMVDLLEK